MSQYYVTALYAVVGINQSATTQLVRLYAPHLALGCLGAPCVLFCLLTPKFMEVMLTVCLASAGAAKQLSSRNRQPATQLFQELHVYFLYLMFALMLVCISGHSLQEDLKTSPFGNRDDGIPRVVCSIFFATIVSPSLLAVSWVLTTENYRIEPGRGWFTFPLARAPCPIAPVTRGAIVLMMGQQGNPEPIRGRSATAGLHAG